MKANLDPLQHLVLEAQRRGLNAQSAAQLANSAARNDAGTID
jgi:hypothetical protein